MFKHGNIEGVFKTFFTLRLSLWIDGSTSFLEVHTYSIKVSLFLYM